MQNRRNFLKNAFLLSGAAGFSGILPGSIQKAFAIDPAPGSSYMDAEHIVILMQENRSFDHMLGTLRGVRGFNDPRVVRLPNDNLAWLQTNAAGKTYAPFRLNIKDTSITWMSSLPHARETQTDAWNNGNFDQWLEAKRSHKTEYADMPLTMGHYTREDLPFYYALADAFTVCDQHFCSVLTSTIPNRSMLWSGTVREEQQGNSKANVRNPDYFGDGVSWLTYPERLQKNGVSWKVYQNELSANMGMTAAETAWLSNYEDNPLEWFKQYHVKLSQNYQAHLPETIKAMEADVQKLEARLAANASKSDGAKKTKASLAKKQKALDACRRDLELGQAGFASLSKEAKDLHQRAFATNANDPDSHSLTRMTYSDGLKQQDVAVPKGDTFYRFRKDVQEGTLPTVSWIVAPENFSDHPSAPWYGAWYVSEAMDILTKNQEVWKKTIFILTYDENDGYFDHVPPFVAPDPRDKMTGRASSGIDTAVEYVYSEDEIQQGVSKNEARSAPIGLGFRVPMIVASPWSRGGWVNSQIFDHTSVNQLLAHVLSAKLGRPIDDENISQWRRTVSGDLTTVFRPFDGEKLTPLPYLQRDPFIEEIYKAKFKEVPTNFHELKTTEIASINQNPTDSALLPRQEKGVRPSCSIPYELYVDGTLNRDVKTFHIQLKVGNKVFGRQALGAPFNVVMRGTKLPTNGATMLGQRPPHIRSASYAVAPADSLQESWPLDMFVDEAYHFTVYGPNGFFRQFTGNHNDPALDLTCDYETKIENSKKLTGNIALHLANAASKATYQVQIIDNAYGAKPISKTIVSDGSGDGRMTVLIPLEKSFGWYDFSVKVAGFDGFEKRYAGRIETGAASFSDPFMGRTLG